MTRTPPGLAAVLAGLALTAGLAACSSTDDTSQPTPSTPAIAAESTTETIASHATPSPSAEEPAAAAPAGIVEAITAAGGQCGPVAERTERSCTLNGVSFTLAETGWESQAADRQRACDEGFINTEYQLLSDGRWTIAADYDEDYATIRSALAGQRVTAELRPYC